MLDALEPVLDDRLEVERLAICGQARPQDLIEVAALSEALSPF